MANKDQNLTLWYDQLLSKAQLVSYGDVKGTNCFLPNSWNLWLQIQRLYNNATALIKLKDKVILKQFIPIEPLPYTVEQVQLPTLSFYSEYQKEKRHVEGFNPELFLIEQIGTKKLHDPLVLRPTSEIAFCNLWKKQSFSYQNLPVIYNQWTCVFRAEKNTRPFLRNSEFYWQETHGLFSDGVNSESAAIAFWKLYQDIIVNQLCIPAFVGLKSPNERFAGAQNTWTVESIMPDGQALQCATSHDLGQTFTKPFGLTFQNQANQQAIPYSFSCGISTRILGALLLTHSNDFGLILPWKVAPIQVKLYLFDKKGDTKTVELAQKVQTLLEQLAIRFQFIKVENQLGKQLGQGEVNGIPFQLIVDNPQTVNIFNRLTRVKTAYSFEQLASRFVELVQKYHQAMYDKAKAVVQQKVVQATTLKQIEQAFNDKKAVLCAVRLTDTLEQQLKERYQVTVRCCLEQLQKPQICPFSGESAQDYVLIARAY
ncbi:proline--tRNA ligase [Mycoplasmoides pneumoniae]|uniref:Proline--tRNA ligase n=1 Tax=Mycoplasmoides pneumoniae 309 TaxID=1112856 RepID=A0AB33HN14_MYCPM|nr:proline--tRNA ligase [Mycoplasmoides pneumoniae]BAL21979.1 prolyl-tRNA synthetase [Mycoplasmoides pneumoniae 309]